MSEIPTKPSAQQWAKAFIEHKIENKWSIDDIDEGLLIGWFANFWAVTHDPLQSRIESLEAELKHKDECHGTNILGGAKNCIATKMREELRGVKKELKQARLAFDDRNRVIELQLEDKKKLKATLAAVRGLPRIFADIAVNKTVEVVLADELDKLLTEDSGPS